MNRTGDTPLMSTLKSTTNTRMTTVKGTTSMKSTLRRAISALALVALLAPALSAAAAQPVDRMAPRSPLAAYPGFGHDAAADEARYEAEELARERMVAACMAAEGFEYEPAPSVSLDGFDTPEAAMAFLRSDPNEEYLRGLDAAERQRYDLALYGVANPDSPRAEDLHDPESLVGGGCLASAHRQISGVFATRNELREELRDLERAFLADPRVAAAERVWSACMSAAGFDHATPRALRASLDRTLDRLRAASAAESAFEAAMVTHRAAEAAGQTCAASTGFAPKVRTVRVEYERRLVDRHRPLLDRHAQRQARNARAIR